MVVADGVHKNNHMLEIGDRINLMVMGSSLLNSRIMKER